MANPDPTSNLLERLIPHVVAIVFIGVCCALILCGEDGVFKNILLTLVGYYFGQVSRSGNKTK